MSDQKTTTAQATSVIFDESEFCGLVTVGDQHGRNTGFPTAGLPLLVTQIVPSNGVCCDRVTLHDGGRSTAAINIGVRSTIDAAGVRLLESTRSMTWSPGCAVTSTTCGHRRGTPKPVSRATKE